MPIAISKGLLQRIAFDIGMVELCYQKIEEIGRFQADPFVS